MFVVDDRPETLTFIVAIDDQLGAPAAWQSATRRRSPRGGSTSPRWCAIGCPSGAFECAGSGPTGSAAPSVGCATTSARGGPHPARRPSAGRAGDPQRPAHCKCTGCVRLLHHRRHARLEVKCLRPAGGDRRRLSTGSRASRAAYFSAGPAHLSPSATSGRTLRPVQESVGEWLAAPDPTYPEWGV